MIEGEKLILIPLDSVQLVKFIQSNNMLETELGLHESKEIMSDDLKEALEVDILPSVADSDKDYLYYTLWIAIDENENRIVGNICLKGEPNDDGEVEIGYGIYDEFQNKGYMTEIVAIMIEWLSKRPEIKLITAFTEKDNIPSMRVLEKNMFARSGEKDELMYWTLQMKKWSNTKAIEQNG